MRSGGRVIARSDHTKARLIPGGRSPWRGAPCRVSPDRFRSVRSWRRMPPGVGGGRGARIVRRHGGAAEQPQAVADHQQRRPQVGGDRQPQRRQPGSPARRPQGEHRQLDPERERDVLADDRDRPPGAADQPAKAMEVAGEKRDVCGLDRGVAAGGAHRDPQARAGEGCGRRRPGRGASCSGVAARPARDHGRTRRFPVSLGNATSPFAGRARHDAVRSGRRPRPGGPCSPDDPAG